MPDRFRFPDVLWARITRTGEDQYQAQIALIGQEDDAQVILPARDLTAEEVERLLNLFASLEFWVDASGLYDQRNVIAPTYRWDDLVSQPGNTRDVITGESQAAIVEFLRDLAEASTAPAEE